MPDERNPISAVCGQKSALCREIGEAQSGTAAGFRRAIAAGILFLAVTCYADPSPAFYRALHQVETGGRVGPIKGDGGRALGPYQIHRAYWQDSRVPGRYEDCAGEPYARRVVAAYLKRYAPAAFKAGDAQTLSRIHNGGPRGHKKQATISYWRKVKKHEPQAASRSNHLPERRRGKFKLRSTSRQPRS